MHSDDRQDLLGTLVGDGTPLISLAGLALIFSGGFAIFLSATGSFLPHDIDFLGMQPATLCAINECRIVHFMFHDRVAFGGVLIAIGILYLWLATFPLRNREAWAWWALVISGSLGFASFLSYLGYGYLDTWHGWATLGLLPCFLYGMWRLRRSIRPCKLRDALRDPGERIDLRAPASQGRLCLLSAAVGTFFAGVVIMTVGMTSVFVPEDLAYIGLDSEKLRAINPRLISLIAHDRAGFGGGLASTGILVGLIVWKARFSRHLGQALLVAGGVGFACAIGVHYPIGYTTVSHLAPAWLGAIVFAVGMWRSFLCSRSARERA